MAGDAAIAEVGLTLVELLRRKMTLVERDDIALASPATIGDRNDTRLTLCLYRITENGDLKNARRHEEKGEFREPPLVLDLYYLLTAHLGTVGNDETDRTNEQHMILGQAMQVLHDNAILRGTELIGSLGDDPDDPHDVEEEVRIAVTPTEQPSFDTLVSLWGTFPDLAYQPSLSYLVSPVEIDSTRTTTVRRVVEKEEQYHDDRAGEGRQP
ncbi:DUF4255 domain-containing protein [Halobium salinum]|uniref:DUF4255 domain-containing protein n=1 Tax=Halobium salinum TaxID=1364940 RepID=A0ABD5PIH9_9EURY|nr:DUF4255 domain-containing protein [Halobium salinum]